jgi:hypothetical protein
MNTENFLVQASSADEPTTSRKKPYLVIDTVSMHSSLSTTISTLGGMRIDMAENGIEAINRLEHRTTSSCAIWAAARMASNCWRKPSGASWSGIWMNQARNLLRVFPQESEF